MLNYAEVARALDVSQPTARDYFEIEGNFGRVAFEIKHRSAVRSHDLQSLRDFVREQNARVGVVINNDHVTRRYDDNLLGVPFHWL